jgi:membrane-associated phospholipid phosphatase
VRAERFQWSVIAELMKRPQPVTVPMLLLFAIVPFYLVIGAAVSGGPVHIPELQFDRDIPVVPGWSLVYGSLFLAAVLPVLVVHQHEHVDRTIRAFLWVWLVGYVCFFFYPTASSRPAQVPGVGFGDWGLRVIYSSDFRYNCLPSLHVAQCFLAALTCSRVHRGVGAAAIVWASLVALSTLFTKQHYVLDVVTGVMLAYAAYAIFVRGFPREAIPERERRYAPVMAAGAALVYAVIVLIFWILYATGVEP